MLSDQDLPDIEIGYSPDRLLNLFGLGLLMTAVSAPMAFHWYGIRYSGIILTAVGYLGLLLFGFATCKSLWLLVSPSKPVVFIGRNGIRDTRVSNELIEWGFVEKVTLWQYNRQKAVILKVAPLIARRLARTGLRRLLSSANKMLGADGVTINPAALTLDADTLFDTCERYRAAFLLAHRHDADPQSVGDADLLPAMAPSEAPVGVAGFRLPWLTFVLLAVLILVFVLENVFAVTPNIRSDPSLATLFAFGALSAKAILSNGQWYRLFTAPLLHANFAHLAGNGVALLMGGWLLERYVGRLWFFALFFIGAVGGSLMSLAVGPANLISVGASGALMGLFAALCVSSFRLDSGDPARLRMQINSARILIPSLLPLYSTSSVHIDYGAHFGGALAGAIVAAILLAFWPKTERLPQLRKVAGAVSVAGVILFVGSAAIVAASYPAYRAALQRPPANSLPTATPSLRPDPSSPETQADILQDHGPGRVACDLQWSKSSGRSADSYPNFLRACMKK